MIVAEYIAEVRARVAQWRRDGARVAFAPTMGNLHAGHLALVARAKELADRVVVSIFVNPLQFGPNEDFATYPRTLERDREALEASGVDMLFTPSVAEMYPRPLDKTTMVRVPELSDILCGVSRPKLFDGVATVVNRLFNIVQPDIAVFGEKDYQQLLIIRRMVEDLCMPVEVVGVATTREADGLALSSRNGYLSQQEREQGAALHRTLVAVRDAVQKGRRDYAALEHEATAALGEAGFRPDYVSIRRAEDLATPQAGEAADLIVLAAAWLGRARLIDNLKLY